MANVYMFKMVVTAFLFSISTVAYAFEYSVVPQKLIGGEGLLLSIMGSATDYYEIFYGEKSYVPYSSDSEKEVKEIYLPIGIESAGLQYFNIRRSVADDIFEEKEVSIDIEKRVIQTVHLVSSDEKMRDDQPMIDKQNALVLEMLAVKSEKILWFGEFIMPIESRVSTNFAVKRIGERYSYFHKGMDFSAPEGSPVKAANSGIVIFSRKGLSVYGNTMIIDHGQGVVSCYFHLSRLLKKKGENVEKGEYIGKVGSSGWATGPHLHFGIYLQGQAVDPLWWTGFIVGKYDTTKSESYDDAEGVVR